MGASDYLEDKVLDHVFNNTAYTSPTSVYVSLHSADPGENGANELGATGAYARVAAGPSVWGASSAGALSNTSAITFPTATANWNSGNNITHFGVWDAASSGNFLLGGALTTAKPVLNGDTASFPIGDFDVTMT